MLLQLTDRIMLEVVHDALELEPPTIQEEGKSDQGEEPSGENKAKNKKLKRKKSSYKGKQRKKLNDIINKSTILSKDDKRVAVDFVDQIKTKQDLGLFLCALLTNASPNARVRLIDSAIRASKEKPEMGFDNQAKGQYRKVIQNCSKLKDINRTTALKAIDSIQNHELAGAILQALLEGASPYTMLALANIGESKDNASSSMSPMSTPLPTVEKITNFGDADKPVPHAKNNIRLVQLQRFCTDQLYV